MFRWGLVQSHSDKCIARQTGISSIESDDDMFQMINYTLTILKFMTSF